MNDYHIGIETEKTPAEGTHTLLVVGVKPVDEIENLAEKYRCGHINFGTDRSFNPAPDDYEEWTRWEEMIKYFLEKGYMCTLVIPLNLVEVFHDGGLNEYDNFIPQIVVPIPYIKLWNYNTIISIDDLSGAAADPAQCTNPGVWTHYLHDLMDRSKFTSNLNVMRANEVFPENEENQNNS